MNYFIGIDVGTSATKSVLFDEKGKIVSTASSEYELIQPQNGWAEQRPNDWKNAVIETLKHIANDVDDSSEIKGIGVSGQMHGMVLLDNDLKPICNSIIWCDQRTQKEVDQIIEIIGKERYIELTLNAPNTSFTLSKLLWVKNNHPEIYKKIYKVLLPKDYINFCLTGNFATDVSDASGTGYFDVANRKWSNEILNTFEISEELLPIIYQSSQSIGTINEEIANSTGLSKSTVIVAGAGDNAAAAIGNGIISENTASVSLGTSGVVFTSIDKPIYDPKGRVHTFCHAVDNMWHMMGVTQGCGLSVSWFKHNFADKYSYKELDEKASNITSDGVIFLPYLMGERTPHLDSDCRGSFTGLSSSHNTFNLYRAILEGICFSLKDCCSVIEETGVSVNFFKACGGGANSNLWLQILADVLGKELYSAESSEKGALGVAILASVGSGVYSSIDVASNKMNSSELSKIEYIKSNNLYYNKIYLAYRKLYYAIKEALKKL